MQNPFYNANSICKMSGGSCAGVELNISYYCHIMATNNRLIAHSAFRILLGAGGFVHFACASVCVCGCRVRGIVSTLTWNVIWIHTTAFNCICRAWRDRARPIFIPPQHWNIFIIKVHLRHMDQSEAVCNYYCLPVPSFCDFPAPNFMPLARS
jgi:hypothetical protein